MRDYNSVHSDAPLKLGVYVSPWDRNNWTYGGKDENGKYPYLEYVFRTQITEVIKYVEEYGGGKVILFELWLDGASTPSGWYGGQLYADHVAERSRVYADILPNGRADIESFKNNHQYDYAGKLTFNLSHRNVTLPSDWRDRIYSVAQEVVDSYTPTEGHEVMIFGSQIRWVGNEQGWAGRTNWIMPPDGGGNLANTIGSETTTTVKPAEADMKTQNGWFYTANEDKGAAKMIEFWYRSVGRNATLLLNFSPDTRGVIPSYNLESAQTMWNTVSSDFDENLAARAYKVSASHVRDNHGQSATDAEVKKMNGFRFPSQTPSPSTASCCRRISASDSELRRLPLNTKTEKTMSGKRSLIRTCRQQSAATATTPTSPRQSDTNGF